MTRNALGKQLSRRHSVQLPRKAGSSSWDPLDPPPLFAVEELTERAWGIREQVKEKLRRKLRQNNRKLFRAMSSSRGSFFSDDEVSGVVGSKNWIAMPRFPVQQGTKVDDGPRRSTLFPA